MYFEFLTASEIKDNKKCWVRGYAEVAAVSSAEECFNICRHNSTWCTTAIFVQPRVPTTLDLYGLYYKVLNAHSWIKVDAIKQRFTKKGHDTKSTPHVFDPELEEFDRINEENALYGRKERDQNYQNNNINAGYGQMENLRRKRDADESTTTELSSTSDDSTTIKSSTEASTGSHPTTTIGTDNPTSTVGDTENGGNETTTLDPEIEALKNPKTHEGFSSFELESEDEDEPAGSCYLYDEHGGATSKLKCRKAHMTFEYHELNCDYDLECVRAARNCSCGHCGEDCANCKSNI